MPLRVIVDCNVYISLLIGGSMAKLTDHLFSDHVELVLSDKSFAEIFKPPPGLRLGTLRLHP